MADNRTHICETRRFGIAMAIILAIAAGLIPWHGRWHGPACLALSGLSVVIAVLWPRLLVPLEWTWAKLGRGLGVVSTFLILTVTYYLLLTPIGLAMRLAGKPGLKLKWDRNTLSYWEPVETDGPSGRPDKPF